MTGGLMKKHFRKVLSVAMCLLLAMTTMVGALGCSDRNSDAEPIDKTKTQLYIATYGGGYGTAFLQDIEDRFEKWAIDNQKSYEDGKVGVQIYKTASKSKYTANNLVTSIDNDAYEVYFVTNDALNSFVNDEVCKLYDITDAVTSDNPFDSQGKSIQDRIRPEMDDHHNLGDSETAKYYSLPFVDGGSGLTYDKDVFVKNELYFKKGGCASEFSAYTQANNTSPAVGTYSGDPTFTNGKNNVAKSAGPDGKYGTEDDGLPATLAEFELLVKQMKKKGVTSIIWSGATQEAYTPFLARAFANNYHGLAESAILKDGGGANGRETTIITGFDNDGNPILEKNHKIGMDNLEDIARQAGYYYGLRMFEIMLENGTEDSTVWQGKSHTEAQYKYIFSLPDAKIKDIAFLLDGTWWENEADAAGSFDKCVKYLGANTAREKRNFAFFPMPWADESQIGNKYTMAGGGGSFFVSERLPKEKQQLIKDFIQFAFSDESLQRMTINIGIPAPFDYEMNETYEPQMSSYTRSFYNIYRKSDIVYGFIDPELSVALKDINDVITYTSSYDSTTSKSSYGTFPSAWRGKHISSQTFFTGMYYRAQGK